MQEELPIHICEVGMALELSNSVTASKPLVRVLDEEGFYKLARWRRHEVWETNGRVKDAFVDLLFIARVEGRVADKELIVESPKTIEIDHAAMSARRTEHLRGDVLRRATERVAAVMRPKVIAREAEVGELDMAIEVEENVLRLEVAIDDVLRVEVLDGQDDLYEVELSYSLRETGLFQKMEEELTAWTEIKHEVDIVLGH